MIVTAIFQLGLAFNHYLTLTDAVRVATRAAAISGGSSPAAVAAGQRAAGELPVQMTVTVVTPDVTVTGRVPYSINIFGLPVKSGFLTSSTTERIE